MGACLCPGMERGEEEEIGFSAWLECQPVGVRDAH